MAHIVDSKSTHAVQISVSPEFLQAARSLADSVERALADARALLDLLDQDPEGDARPVCALGGSESAEQPEDLPPWYSQHPQRQ